MKFRKMTRTSVAVAVALGALGAGAVAATPAQALQNGTVAAPGQYPFYTLSPSGCGGALISPTWVITAKHCAADPVWDVGQKVHVGWAGDNPATSGIERTVREAVLPPSDTWDIVLLRVDAVPGVAPLAIGDRPSVGDTVRSVANGTGSNGLLTTAQFSVVSTPEEPVNSEHASLWARALQSGVGVRPGDSGSPLISEAKGTPQLLGVTGSGDGASLGLWGSTTYAPVHAWITSTLGSSVGGNPDPGKPASFAASHPGYYEIRNVGTGMALDVSGGSVASGANIIQWPFTNGSNQRWSFADINGSAGLKPQSSGDLLGLKGDFTVLGQPAAQVRGNGAPEQSWSIEPTSDGHYLIVNARSAQVLAVSGGSTQAGTQVIQWPSTGGAEQKWDLVKVG